MKNNQESKSFWKGKGFYLALTLVIAGAATASFLAINSMPVMAQSLADIPVLGSLVQFVDLRSRGYSWGDTSFNAVYPIMEIDEGAYEKTPEAPLPDGITDNTAA